MRCKQKIDRKKNIGRQTDRQTPTRIDESMRFTLCTDIAQASIKGIWVRLATILWRGKEVKGIEGIRMEADSGIGGHK